MFGEIRMNESSLLINSPFALKQQNNVPIYVKFGDKIERPYNDSEIKESLKRQIIRDRKAGVPKDEIEKKCYYLDKFMQKLTKKEDEKTEYPIDLQRLERIIITPRAKGYITNAFIDYIKSNNIAIYWIDVKGRVDASFIPFNFKNPSLIVKQVEARNNGKSLEIAKYIIKLKLKSQGLKDYIHKLDKTKDIKEIIQIEGVSANIYFKQWKFSKEWNWKGRHGKISGNKYAVDPVNTMLNLGYGLLVQRMSEILLKRGFELSIGFLHVNDYKAYWNMLVYDCVEPYRVWIDIKVLEMVSRLRIKPDDFTFTDDKKSLIFKDKAFDIVLDEFMNVLNPLEHKSLPMIREIGKILQ